MTTSIDRLALAAACLLLALDAAAGPDIKAWRTDNGARVMYVQAPEIALLDVRVTFAAGSARDGDQKGIADLTSALLKQGAGDLDADAFATALGATGATLSAGARRDMAYLSLRTLSDSRYAEPALELMRKAMAAPRFDHVAITRVKGNAMIGLRHKQQSPGRIAEDKFYASVYGDHPYGSPPDGVAATVQEFGRDDFVAFHQRYYVAKNAVIAIVGAVDEARARAIANTLAAALPAGEAAAELPGVQTTSAVTHAVEYDSIQSHIRVGLPGMTRTDPDYFPLLVGNHALGGNALVSLLFEEIRARRGLSYSAYSYFAPMASAGPFIATLQTDRAQQDEALAVLRQTISDFVTKGPPEAELEAAKKNLIGGFPLRIDSNRKIAEYLSVIGFYNLPLDYLDTFTGKVAAVTPAAVRDAFERRVRLDEMVTVIVGRKNADGNS